MRLKERPMKRVKSEPRSVYPGDNTDLIRVPGRGFGTTARRETGSETKVYLNCVGPKGINKERGVVRQGRMLKCIIKEKIGYTKDTQKIHGEYIHIYTHTRKSVSAYLGE